MNQIDADLNLVIPIRCKYEVEPDPKLEGKFRTMAIPLVWAYHRPLGEDVFEANYRAFAFAKQEIWGKGLDYAAETGPRVARLTLLDATKADAAQRGTPDAGPTLLAEIRNATTILVPGDDGFKMDPVDIAIRNTFISAQEWKEAESNLVFFTLAFALASYEGKTRLANWIAGRLIGSITSLSLMDWAASWKPSTSDATSATPPDTERPVVPL